MKKFFLDSLIKSPIFGSLSLTLAERSIRSNFSVYTTQSKLELEEIYKLRYQVYCKEYRYLDPKDYPDKKESDAYDINAIHLVVREKNGEIVATTRLIILPKNELPTYKNFKIGLDIPGEKQFAEISRLIVAKKYRRKHLLLVLIKSLYQIVKANDIQNVFCVLDDRLLPNIHEIGIPIVKIGSSKMYQGITAPYLIPVKETEEVLKEKNKYILKFITSNSLGMQEAASKYSLH